LLAAAKLAGPALHQVLLGQLKPVFGGRKRFKPRHRGLAAALGAHKAVGLMVERTTRPRSWWSWLAKALGALDKYHRGVGHVDADLDHRVATKISISWFAKRAITSSFSFGVILLCKISISYSGKDFFFEPLGLGLDRLGHAGQTLCPGRARRCAGK
jgi:hypothetical protein